MNAPVLSLTLKCEKCRRWRIRAAWFIAALLVAVLGWNVGKALGHNTSIIGCTNNIIYTEAKLLAEGMYEGPIEGWQNMWGEVYDTNGDGQPDILALSHVKSKNINHSGGVIVHDPNPVFYLVDLYDQAGNRNPDGIPDAIYIDKRGQGICDDIVPYIDLRVPRGKDHDSRPNAEVRKHGKRNTESS